jgi:hypothetical protein
MDWDVRLADRAKRSFERMPASDRGRVEAVLIAMKQIPTPAIRGRYKEGSKALSAAAWGIGESSSQ